VQDKQTHSRATNFLATERQNRNNRGKFERDITMLSSVGGLLTALVGLIVGLFGLSIGLALVIAVMAPVLIVLLLPALLMVILLRKFGIVRTRRASFIAMLLCIAVLVSAMRGLWALNPFDLPSWLDAQQMLLEACGDQDQPQVTIVPSDQGLEFTCKATIDDQPKRRRRIEGTDI
jgi:hypothetical protein